MYISKLDLGFPLCCAILGIDGPEDMKLIFGIIAVEGKANRGKGDKVSLTYIFVGIFIMNFHLVENLDILLTIYLDFMVVSLSIVVCSILG